MVRKLMTHPRMLPYVVDICGYNIQCLECLTFFAEPMGEEEKAEGKLHAAWHIDFEDGVSPPWPPAWPTAAAPTSGAGGGANPAACFGEQNGTAPPATAFCQCSTSRSASFSATTRSPATPARSFCRARISGHKRSGGTGPRRSIRRASLRCGCPPAPRCYGATRSCTPWCAPRMIRQSVVLV